MRPRPLCVASLLLPLALVLAPDERARADVVADSDCRSWERWEGGHDGACRPGPRWMTRCSASPSPGAPRSLAGAGLLVGALAATRRSRRA